MVILLTVFELVPFKKALQNALIVFLLPFFFFLIPALQKVFFNDLRIQTYKIRICDAAIAV